jgi:hypothetical protein
MLMNPEITPRGVSRPSPSGSTGAFAAAGATAGFVPTPGNNDDTCPAAIAPEPAQSATASINHKNFPLAFL